MTWHAERGTLDSYLNGGLAEAYACSVEAHVIECEQCRASLASAAAGDVGPRHDDTWERILDRVDQPTQSVLGRLLGRWLPAEVVGLVAASPALRTAAYAAGLAMLACAVVAANLSHAALGTAVFLVTAPVVPLAGVALAYARPDALCGEIADAAPYSRLRLLLLRSAAVAALTIPAVLVLGLALPVGWWVAVSWLLPALALCALTLALSTVMPARVAAGALGGLWLAASAVALFPTQAQLGAAQLLERSMVFRPLGQVVLAGLAVVAVVVSFARRREFETGRAA